ncbi:hypothetical protein HJFPF1_10453 [Paramyrothecium foliicola]|nr:hypothetical protein HJFPF1_10453 [Paramyrothecium foliicola]
MPHLADVSYSRDETIAAIRDYYRFLTSMYLPESVILYPPPDGWPNITSTNMQRLGKADEVITLLKHLPYIEDTSGGAGFQAAPWCTFADYRSWTMEHTITQGSANEARLITEGSIFEDVPAHVIGLTAGGRDNPVFLLDTKLGIVYWLDCPDGPRHRPTKEKICDDPYEWAPDEEAEWRGESPAWTVPDFFEVLKEEFRSLRAIPFGPHKVYDVYTTMAGHRGSLISEAQNIYTEHHWPELEHYRKDECLAAIERAVQE